MKRFLAFFDEKPKPRNAEQLFRTFAELHFNETMEKGGEGIKRYMGDLRAFFKWAVLERKYLPMEWLPITSKQFSKYIDAVPKNTKKSKVKEAFLLEI